MDADDVVLGQSPCPLATMPLGCLALSYHVMDADDVVLGQRNTHDNIAPLCFKMAQHLDLRCVLLFMRPRQVPHHDVGS